MPNWKKLPHYSRYSISTTGQVRNDNTGKLLAHNMNSTGYKRVLLYNDNSRKYKQCSLHRLLAIVYVPNLEGKECVDHVDCDKTNNDLSNLQWVSKKENTQRAYDAGLNTNKKLSIKDKHNIRKKMHIAVRGTQSQLAREYDVHVSRIRQIINE